MALTIGDNFSYQGKQPNFARDTFNTLADMKAFPETSLDEGHISFCLETGKRYEFFSSNSIDSITGKWRLTIDTALDPTSEKSVQNKIIYRKFSEAETQLAETLRTNTEQINNIIQGLKDKIEQYDDVIEEGDLVSAKAITELKEYIEDCNKAIAAAVINIKQSTASLDIIINGHPLSEGSIELDKSDIGLGNVDNTSDVNKPISNETQAALDGKVDTREGYSLISSADLRKLSEMPTASRIDEKIQEVNENVDEHRYKKDNPHEVTMEQLGVPTELNKKVDKTTTINGFPLSDNIILGKDSVGLANVDNISDINKEVSIPQREAIDKKADEVSELTAYSLTEISKKLEDLEKTISISLNDIWKRITMPKQNVGTEDEFPENPEIGSYFFNTTDNSPYWWDGSTWKKTNLIT